MPLSDSLIHQTGMDRQLETTCRVSSVDPPSTTIHSKGTPPVKASKERMVCCNGAAAFSVAVTMLTYGESLGETLRPFHPSLDSMNVNVRGAFTNGRGLRSAACRLTSRHGRFLTVRASSSTAGSWPIATVRTGNKSHTMPNTIPHRDEMLNPGHLVVVFLMSRRRSFPIRTRGFLTTIVFSIIHSNVTLR